MSDESKLQKKIIQLFIMQGKRNALKWIKKNGTAETWEMNRGVDRRGGKVVK